MTLPAVGSDWDQRPARTALPHLDELEAEAVAILRETAGQFERPAILFSGGKDSMCAVHLASKAFAPARIPFALLHVDTGHDFPEVVEFRDRVVAELGLELIVARVQDHLDRGQVVERPDGSRNELQTVPLLDSVARHRFDALVGGNPRRQRPELWQLSNGLHVPGRHVRVFPLSDWTELDVWRYIEREGIELPSIYFSHPRQVFVRDVITEISSSRVSERGASRIDDRLGVPEVATVPVSALRGDDVIAPSTHTDWYGGPTLLEYLESVPVGDADGVQAARLPVQCTIAADDGRQLPAGQLVAGTLRVGEPVAVLPAGRTSVIESIDVLGRQATVATAPQSVTVRLADPIDVRRGDLIASLAGSPPVRRHLTPTLCVLTGGGLRVGDRYLLRHGTRIVDATVTRLVDRLDLTTLHRVTEPDVLEVNDIGRVALELDRPLPVDDYLRYRRTGSFLLIDRLRGDTIAAGMTD